MQPALFNPAFSTDHAVFRMLHILSRLEDGDIMEVDRLRIWDFYLLFPTEVHHLRVKRGDAAMRALRKQKIPRTVNPFNVCADGRKMLERLRPYQMTALSHLAARGIISATQLVRQRVVLTGRRQLLTVIPRVGSLTTLESDTLSWLLLYTKTMPMSGEDGLKNRTSLLESRYDGY